MSPVDSVVPKKRSRSAQNSQKGQMRAKLKRDGPGTDLRQSTAANVSDVSLDTNLHNMGSISQPPEEENMSFLEALSAESLNGNFNTDFDMSISSSDSNPINCASANTWATDCDFLDENADILDSSLLGSFCDPYLYQAPADPFDQTLFCHYMENLSLQLYPITLDNNPYRKVYGSLATESQLVFKAILLASALHLSKLGKLPAFAVKPYRVAMQRSFRDSVKTQSVEWSLGATVLLSIIFDVIGTGTDKWSSKLLGCRQLLERTLSTRDGNADAGLRCLLLQYNWAVTMSKTMLRGVVSEAVFDELKCIDEITALKDVVADEDMALHQSQWWDDLPDYQMHLFLREATEYSITIERLKLSPDSTDEILQIMPHVALLVNKIQTWQPKAVTVQSKYMESIHHFNEIWRLGMICFIHGEIYGLDSSDHFIQTCVEGALDHLRKLTWLQACLFPLFMISVHAQTMSARAAFESKLKKMHESSGFQSLLSVACVLKTIWERSDATVGRRFRWRDVIKDLNMELNILL
ncbi:Protein of unknown function DUF3468 [Penicillium brevicompactum]|uniref:Uncharacterized protein n=1 Tax=Penicillium brevicompactum TaxID=5074 RepID=A0A9W9RL06_PENBR|nr:Protein of unknown function DUF3468 [Penicillium brevicompactum]